MSEPVSEAPWQAEERLREALLALEGSRSDEARARHEATALLQTLEAVMRTPAPEKAVPTLLAEVARIFAADAAAIVEACDDGTVAVVDASAPALVGTRFRDLAGRVRRPRRLVAADFARAGAPAPLHGFRSVLYAPIEAAPAVRAIACFAAPEAAFAAADLQLLRRFTPLAQQVLAGRALQQTQRLLAGVISKNPNAVAIVDAQAPERPIVYANPAYERLTGYTAAEPRALTKALLSPPSADDGAARAGLREAVRACRSGRFEIHQRRKDGRWFWGEVQTYPITDATGVARHLALVQADVTARRLAETERDAARAELRAALTATPDGFLVVDAGGLVAFANPAFEHLYPTPGGWRRGRAAAALWAARRAHDGADEATASAEGQAWQRRLFEGTPGREETPAPGTTVLVNTHRTEAGGVVATFTDVTPLKRAERELDARAAAMDAARDGIALADADGRFQYMNASHLQMFGFDEQAEVVGQGWEMLYDPEVAARIRREAFATVAVIGSWRGEVVGRRRDGAPVEQEVSLTMLADGGVVCITRDIGERRRGQRERARLRDELQQAQRRETVATIAASLAHDINNLLSAISGSAGLALDGLDDGAAVRPHLERITAAAASGGELVRRLLDLGARSRQRARIDLRTPVREAVDLVAAGCPPGVVVDLAVPAGPVEASADGNDVLHLLLNLAVNARNAIGDGPGRIAIELAADIATNDMRPVCGAIAPGARYHALSVGDDGPGMDPAEAEDIFKPYFSTRGDQGTGLGLSMVAGIARDYGGAVALETAPGAGARFTVLLPVPAPAVGPKRHSPRPEGPHLAGRAILVAEDRPETLAALVAALEALGAEVGACDTPAAAAEAIAEDPNAWDLLVTDFQMPEMTGAELARRARAAAPGLPILLCTGLDPSVMPIGAGDGLFDGIVRKPVDPTALAQAATTALGAHSEKRTGP